MGSGENLDAVELMNAPPCKYGYGSMSFTNAPEMMHIHIESRINVAGTVVTIVLSKK